VGMFGDRPTPGPSRKREGRFQAMTEAVTRFAPSPNGPLHLGHAYSAIVAHDLAKERGGRFLLRIEDIDGTRSRPELADEFRADLAWLGLEWDEVPAQSTRVAAYASAADQLRAEGLIYPCRCTRAEIAAAAAKVGPDGPVYAGTCRGMRVDPQGAAWRLNVAEALCRTGPLEWTDELRGVQLARPELGGDPVLVRKEADTPASYHLAVTIDDAADGASLVTRGMDLFAATHVHRLLQALLALPVPVWHHHALLLDAEGKKLAKRRGSPSLADRRLAGEDGRALAESLRAGRLPSGITLGEGLSG
jgi:glutamyl-Q tRNA(Asp) synthetase